MNHCTRCLRPTADLPRKSECNMFGPCTGEPRSAHTRIDELEAQLAAAREELRADRERSHLVITGLRERVQALTATDPEEGP